MENFIIRTPFIKEEYIRQNHAYWKFHSTEFWRKIVRYSIFSVCILVIGLISKTEDEPSNPFIFIGIAFLILTLTILYLRFFQRLAYNRKLKCAAARFDEIKLDNTIEFTDAFLKYSDSEKTIEYKWEAFSSFSIYKNYIFLQAEFTLTSAFIFERKADEQDDFEKIYTLINEKVKSKNK
jgi:hypothetical protein